MFGIFSSDESKHCDRHRRTTPKPIEKIGGFFTVYEGPNGHVYRRYTKWRSHCKLPTTTFYKCLKCEMYTTGPYRNFNRRGKRKSCLEHALHEFCYRNKHLGRQSIKQVCDDEGIIEDHQFAEGIGIPTSVV
jgi:hypothetical protein